MRRPPFALLTLGLLALTRPAGLAQPAGGPGERVTYRDRAADGKVVTETGEVRESPRGIELAVAGKTKSIAAADIIRLDPAALAGVGEVELRSARLLEDAKGPNAADGFRKSAAAYADLSKKAGGAPERTKRLLAYREAYYAAKAADALTGDDFAPAATAAVAKLTAAAALARKSWEGTPALRTAARLQAELGDLPKAAATLQTLASTPDLPRDARLDAQLFAAELLLRARQPAPASAILDAAEKDPEFPLSAGKERLALLRAAAKLPPTAESIPKLQEAVDQARDPAAKAAGYALLGEAHAAAGQPREAMWAYLWVDVVYNGNREGHALAVRRLQALFDQQGDKERAEQYREKLPRVR